MGNVYRYTPLFLYEFSFIVIFINTHEYAKKKRKFAYQHIE